MPRITLENNKISVRNIVDIETPQTYNNYVTVTDFQPDETTSDVANNFQITAIAGENILGGVAVTMLNGLCYKAVNKSGLGKYPIGILKTSVLEDEIATILTGGIIDTSLVMNETTENPVYCRVGTLNLSQNLLTATSVDEDSICKIGVPINENQFILEIEKPIVILD
jgi:hypothetical protein